MTPRAGLYPTARAVLLMAAGAPAALTIGIVWPHLWTLGFGWMLFVVLLLGLDMALAARRVTVTLNMPRSAPVGGTVELRLATDTPGSVQATVDIDDRLTPLGPLRPTLSRERPEARIPLEASRRGIAPLSALWLRWKGPLGLVWKQRREPRDEAVLITPDTRPARERSQLFIRHAQAGETARREIGTGAEFQSLKPWIDGMDRRAIDWKQSARHAMLLAKDWQIERNNQIVLAIDAGRAMAEPVGGVPRIDRAVSAALLAAYVALKLDDRVGLFAYAEQPLAASAIGHGIAAFPAIQRLAAGIDYGARETNHTLGLTRLAQRLDRRTLIVLFTEFTDPTSAEIMIESIARLVAKHLVLFVTLEDSELAGLTGAEPETVADIAAAVTAGTLAHQRAVVLQRLRQMNVDVIEAPWSAITYRLIDRYLEIKRAGAIG